MKIFYVHVALLVALSLAAFFHRDYVRQDWYRLVCLGLFLHILYSDITFVHDGCKPTHSQATSQEQNLEEQQEEVATIDDDENGNYIVQEEGLPPNMEDYFEQNAPELGHKKTPPAYSPHSFWQDAVGDTEQRGKPVLMSRGYSSWVS